MYKVVELRESDNGVIESSAIEKILNDMTNQGWSFVQMYPINNVWYEVDDHLSTVVYLIFKK